MRFVATSLIITLGAVGCATDDPFAEDGGDDGSGSSTAGDAGDDVADTATSPTAPDGDATVADDAPTDDGDTGPVDDTGPDDTGPTDDTGIGECPPTPTRFVVLGDSITACFGVGGKDSDDCAPKILHDYLATKLGPLSYENLAVNGAVTHDVPASQLDTIEVGMPGHVLVMIYIGGNDLSGYIFDSDEHTLSDYEMRRPELDADWADTLAFFQDPANFPDGATVFMNSQYDPFDDCTAPPYNLSQVKIDLLNDYNDDLIAKADAQPNAYIAEQHGPFLGHGHHYNVASCPYYIEGAEYWMTDLDLIHPTAPGHANIASVLSSLADDVYAGCE